MSQTESHRGLDPRAGLVQLSADLANQSFPALKFDLVRLRFPQNEADTLKRILYHAIPLRVIGVIQKST